MVDYDKILEDLQRRATGKPELAETVSLHTDLISAPSRAMVGVQGRRRLNFVSWEGNLWPRE